MHPVENYLKTLSEIHRTGGGTAEESYYGSLETLLDQVGGKLKPKVRAVESFATGGRPVSVGPTASAVGMARAADEQNRDIALFGDFDSPGDAAPRQPEHRPTFRIEDLRSLRYALAYPRKRSDSARVERRVVAQLRVLRVWTDDGDRRNRRLQRQHGIIQ